MKEFIFQKQWGWKTSGLALAFIFVLAVVLVKPIGVSTQFVILDGIIWNAVSDKLIEKDDSAKKGYSSSNAYLNKSGGKYAHNIENPLNYSFIFVFAMIVGGFLSSKILSKKDNHLFASKETTIHYKGSATSSYVKVFIGGVLVLIGARLAGGCSSGHMMSGMMQTSISGYLFVLGVFIVAIPLTLFIHKKGAK
jgi:hypothetical protein